MATAKLPADFLWGFATASYQIEGAVNEDGRGPSIWDSFCKIPGKIADGTSGDIACDSYHRTADDIALLKQYGAKVSRFSISWTRIIPLGGRNDPINEKGLQFYIKLIEDLLASGIIPFVTLSHWDIPEGLEKRYGGMLNKDEFVADFANYARVVFSALAGKVKHWITFNEPWCSAVLGYNVGVFAPGRTSDRSKSAEGDSATECWIVGHNLLVAHGAAVKVYRDEFKPRFGGEIGIVLNGDWADPWDPQNPADIAACEKKIEFFISWFADPIYHGKYPDSMIEQLGPRLPSWTPEDLALVHGSNDFYGMNTYCAHYVRSRPAEFQTLNPADFTGNVDILQENKAGESIGPETDCSWLRPNPQGFRKLLKWLSDRYNRPKIFVTENGTSVKGENGLALDKLLEDDFRVWYFREYIAAMADAVTLDGVDVRGYMAWSLLDNFEWADGYKVRFGVTYVDYNDGQKRVPKKSGKAIGEIFKHYIEK